MKRRYVTVDVFADRQFEGNPLGVVLDAQGLSTAQMQAIATEFNYAECTFVLPPKNPAHTAHVRIFTPRMEIPFAGHPNVGTAFVLARRQASHDSPRRIVFEEAAGLVPVEILMSEGKIVGAELTAPEPLSRRSRVSPATVAKCLGLAQSDIQLDSWQPQVISVGLPFVVAELSSRDALGRAKPDVSAHADLLPIDDAVAIYVYTRDIAAGDGACDVAARMFAPIDGVLEDPATGSATAAVAAMLAEAAPEREGELRLRFLQGADMGRPSHLQSRVVKREGKVESVHVGGRCAPVMEGEIDLDP